MPTWIDLDTLPRCPECATVRLTAVCWACRAAAAERALDTRRLSAPEPLVPLAFECALARTCMAIAGPQEPLAPELLTVDPDCDRGVLIMARVGNRVQNHGRALPLSLFSSRQWASPAAMRELTGRLLWDPVHIAQHVTLHLSFPSMSAEPVVEEARKALGYDPHPTTFRATLWCRQMRG